jgi:hypothetical protein
MAFNSSPDFRPTCVTTFIRSFDSGAGTLLVETDAGRAYIKAKGNPGGPHVLACEYVGTRLATLLGLPTFDYALIQVDEIDELPFANGKDFAEPGTAFAARSETGTTWGQDKRLLGRLGNVDEVSRLVVFDTWVLNSDRYDPNGSRINLDNVFFSSESSGFEVELRIMDHTHCFTNGRDLTARVKQIGIVKDEAIYGLFPEFKPLLDREVVCATCEQLTNLSVDDVGEIVHSIPRDWSVGKPARDALQELIIRRAEYVAETIEESLFGPIQGDLFQTSD